MNDSDIKYILGLTFAVIIAFILIELFIFWQLPPAPEELLLPKIENFNRALWYHRDLDVFLQSALILTGVLIVLMLLREIPIEK